MDNLHVEERFFIYCQNCTSATHTFVRLFSEGGFWYYFAICDNCSTETIRELNGTNSYFVICGDKTFTRYYKRPGEDVVANVEYNTVKPVNGCLLMTLKMSLEIYIPVARYFIQRSVRTKAR